MYGRHLNCSCWCGVQYWSAGLSHLSKTNFTNYHIFPANASEQESIYRQVCGDISRDLFRKLCKTAWSEPYSFLNVDRLLPETKGKYGRSFEQKYHLVPNNDDQLWKKCCRPYSEKERRETTEKQRKQLPWKRGRESDREASHQAGLSGHVQGRGVPNSY